MILIALILQICVTNVITGEYSEVVHNFKSIRKNVALSILVIDGDESNIDSSSLSSAEFVKVPNIEDLYIINILNSLDKNIFTSLHRLQHLKIEENELSYIGPAVWAGLDLEKLSLRNNQIEKLDNRAFDGLKASMIDLSNNKLRTLPNKCLQSLRLYKLTLANNQLEDIDLETFGPELAYADLSNNLLTSLDVEVFSGVYALLNLNLSGNKLTSIVAAPTLKKLKVLNYSHNQISVIAGNAFDSYNQLMELYLDHNQIFRLNHQSFPSIAPIKKFTIDHNYLTGLSDELLNALDNLAYLKFGGNPWSCKCLERVLEFIRSNKIGTDYCESKLIPQGHSCVNYYDKCYGNETKI